MLGQSVSEATVYDKVAVLIGDSNLRLAQAIQKSLGDRGLKNVVVCGDAPDLVAQLDRRFIDLLVLDHILPGLDLVDVVQRIRRHVLGKNPFAAIIAMIGKTEAGSTRATVEAGVDDIVSKPLTADRLLNSVSTLTQSSRSFVVSADYIGPSRRHTPRPDDNPGKVRDVPNTLRSRMIELAGDREVERMVARAAALMSDDRFEAAIVEIDRLVTRIVAHFQTKGSHETRQKDLERLVTVAELWRTQYDGASKDVVVNLGGMLITLASRILAAPPGRSDVEVHLLAQLNQAVRGSIDVDHRDARYFAEITQIVTQFTGQAQGRG